MPVPSSPLAEVCARLRESLLTGLQATANSIGIELASPADEPVGDGANSNRLTLFFYRFQPAGFGETHPGDPWRLRVHCLITAFGAAEEGSPVSAGENELRLLAQVMRVFHERPILTLAGEPFAAQTVFQPLSHEELGNLWLSFGDVGYRPSIAYEIALVPIVPSERRVDPRRVGAIGFEARGDVRARHAPFAGSVQGPRVSRTDIDPGDPFWAPRIAFVQGGEIAESLALRLPLAAPADRVRIWVAGAPGAEVDMVTERWDATQGWREVAVSPPLPARSTVIDPDREPVAGESHEVTLAGPLAPRTQLLLYARRRDTRLLSNPLLISLLPVAP